MFLSSGNGNVSSSEMAIAFHRLWKIHSRDLELEKEKETNRRGVRQKGKHCNRFPFCGIWKTNERTSSSSVGLFFFRVSKWQKSEHSERKFCFPLPLEYFTPSSMIDLCPQKEGKAMGRKEKFYCPVTMRIVLLRIKE